MACIFGHKWKGCTCERCGKTRDEQHVFEPVPGKCHTACGICGKQGGESHRWKGCTCEACGQTRKTTSANDHQFPYIDGSISCTCEKCGYNAGKWHHWAYSYQPGQPVHQRKCTICGFTDTAQHYFTDGKCEYCGYTPGIDIPQAVRDFAVYVSLSMDESELDAMEARLLAEGPSAENEIFGFLARCSHGGVGNIQWWNQAKRLTRMLPKFGTPQVREHLAQLVDNGTRSKIWEYQTQVVETAKEELGRM